MIDIKNYMNDGANWQAQAVLAYLRGNYYKVIENTFDKEFCDYRANVKVGRFENCREQGYVFMMNYDFTRIANYAVYEHRNTDKICVVINDRFTTNTPTWEDMFSDRNSAYDIDIDFSYGEIRKCAEWIMEDMKKRLAKFLEEIENKN